MRGNLVSRERAERPRRETQKRTKQMSRKGIRPLLMGLDKPARKIEIKETELTGYESAQRKRFLRTEAVDDEVREAGRTTCDIDV